MTQPVPEMMTLLEIGEQRKPMQPRHITRWPLASKSSSQLLCNELVAAGLLIVRE